jgi:hypothetical protein
VSKQGIDRQRGIAAQNYIQPVMQNFLEWVGKFFENIKNTKIVDKIYKNSLKYSVNAVNSVIVQNCCRF